jgi:serine/threonine protein kinase
MSSGGLRLRQISDDDGKYYKRIKELGKGGFGIVYKVQSLRTGQVWHPLGSSTGLGNVNTDIL